LRVHENTPSVIIDEDSAIASVVLYLRNKSLDFPMIIKPAKPIARPPRLNGKGTSDLAHQFTIHLSWKLRHHTSE
jgi:hypothetical protein